MSEKPEISFKEAAVMAVVGALLWLAVQALFGPGDDAALDPVMPEGPSRQE
ncbi:MAG: hypothetical protein ACLFWF_12100 [Alphaproteobacteria bacterium]